MLLFTSRTVLAYVRKINGPVKMSFLSRYAEKVENLGVPPQRHFVCAGSRILNRSMKGINCFGTAECMSSKVFSLALLLRLHQFDVMKKFDMGIRH